MVDVQFNTQIQVFRNNNGGEYVTSELRKYLDHHDIIHQTTRPYTPQHNGIAKRKNLHLPEVVCASVLKAHLPSSY
ncbi:unnamed protein product [Prunus armeniaca]